MNPYSNSTRYGGAPKDARTATSTAGLANTLEILNKARAAIAHEHRKVFIGPVPFARDQHSSRGLRTVLVVQLVLPSSIHLRMAFTCEEMPAVPMRLALYHAIT